MMTFSRPITEIIASRFSCRAYLDEPISAEKQRRLEEFAAGLDQGPLGTPLRFRLLAASDEDRQALRGLGTYGFIKGSTGFLVGALRPHAQDLEDYGYMLEKLILFATDLGLGTCWLGGTFTRSGFSRKIALAREERMPAVVSIGEIADVEQARQAPLRHTIGGDSRLPWNALFFENRLGAALAREAAGAYALPLEMVRIGPSASNKQPWRIIRDGDAWHFYLQRTPGYPGSVVSTLLRIDDLQRIDLGIAMCHFELTARELGLPGGWSVDEPPIQKPDRMTEYVISWVSTAES
jgi:nitroreductase